MSKQIYTLIMKFTKEHFNGVLGDDRIRIFNDVPEDNELALKQIKKIVLWWLLQYCKIMLMEIS